MKVLVDLCVVPLGIGVSVSVEMGVGNVVGVDVGIGVGAGVSGAQPWIARAKARMMINL